MPTSTPEPPPPPVLPCHDEFEEVYLRDAEEYLWTLEQWAMHWHYWIERYRDQGYHDIPVTVLLAIIMHESRGNPSALSIAGAIGVFQVMPGNLIAGRPPASDLWQSPKNIYHGIGILESYTWEATYHVNNEEPQYRTLRYEAVDQASEENWWYSDVGRAALGMYQCGPGGFRLGRCGPRGGLVYSSNVLDCWVPWVKSVLAKYNLWEVVPEIIEKCLPARRFRVNVCWREHG